MLTKAKASLAINYVLFILGVAAAIGVALSQMTALGKTAVIGGILAAFCTTLGTVLGLSKPKIIEPLPDDHKPSAIIEQPLVEEKKE